MKRKTSAARKRRCTVAIVYHKILKEEAARYYSKQHVVADADTVKAVKYLRGIFSGRGFRVMTIALSPSDLTNLKKLHADYIYNLVDSKAMEIKIARMLDRLSIPHSGSPLEAIRISNNKIRTKKLFERYGIPTPSYTLISPSTRLSKSLIPSKYPVIVKPAFEHCSLGITERSIATSYRQFAAIVRRQKMQYRQTLIAEQFIVGREFQVTVLESPDGTMALPIAEIAFKRGIKNKWNIYGFDEKWNEKLPIFKSAHFVSPPKRIDADADSAIRRDSLKAFYLFGLRDYARFDLRFESATKRWFFLEANANAGITPADPNDAMNASIRAHGMSLREFILAFVSNRLPL